MNHLLLSSTRLHESKVLETGQLNVVEWLQEYADLDIIHLEAPLPEEALMLEWKEVSTPYTSSAMRDLVGKKLASYKFQYLGQFSYLDKAIEAKQESFLSSFPSQPIHKSKLETTGWFNCTWLIDFLVQAPKIAQDSLRNEFLTWRADDTRFLLSLSSENSNEGSAEQEMFVFDNCFETLSWEHTTLFG